MMQRFKSISRYTISALAVLGLIISTAYAQTFFGSSPKQSATTQTSSTAVPPSRVMSNDAFSKTVNQLGKQNMNTLSQQSQATIMKPTPKATVPAASSSAKPTPPPSTGTEQYTADSFKTPAANTPPTQAAPTAPAQSSQVYTGFGTGTPSTPDKKASGSSGESSGWQIQY